MVIEIVSKLGTPQSSNINALDVQMWVPCDDFLCLHSVLLGVGGVRAACSVRSISFREVRSLLSSQLLLEIGRIKAAGSVSTMKWRWMLAIHGGEHWASILHSLGSPDNTYHMVCSRCVVKS